MAGIKLNFAENVMFLYRIIWAIWGYFLYRYFIYFLEEGRHQLSSYWQNEFESVVGEFIKLKVHEKYDSPNDGAGYGYYATKRNNMIYSGQISVWKMNNSTSKVEEFCENIEVSIRSPMLYFYQVKAVIKFLTLRPVVTDYLFAFIFSFFVLVLSELTTWHGSLLSVVF